MRLGKMMVRTLAAVVVLTGFVDAASASMLYVDYLIREVPEDPNSNVIYIISLGIEAEQTEGDWVGWLIGEVAIVRPGSVGQTEAYWIEDSPYVPTSDGLWWVEHVDISHPLAEEFDNTPKLAGIAVANDPYDDDMEYDMVGKTFSGEFPRYDERVSAQTLTLTFVGEEEPEEEGDDEPVEVDDPWGEAPYA